MNGEEWRARLNDRSLRYAGRVLDPERRIVLTADPEYIRRFDGQVAIITATNLFGRMTPSIALDIPRVPIVAPLPWAGQDLRDYILNLLGNIDPFAEFPCPPTSAGDYVISFGRTGDGLLVHGTGWNAYAGDRASALPPEKGTNPVGPALAAILAAAGLFRTDLRGQPAQVYLNGLDWCAAPVRCGEHRLDASPDLGDIWAVGTGSVGTAILYFLSLVSRDFAAALIDMDKIKIENLDRSPMFFANHIGMEKVAVTKDYLKEIGVRSVQAEAKPLDKSRLWRDRQSGTPDLLIAAANERNVRSIIENDLPPIQIYGTTGKNWQAAVIRHVPGKDPCSLCLFPKTDYAPTECATGKVERKKGGNQVDAALPFLSFGAGLMAAAEILKLGLPDYPYHANRVVLNMYEEVRGVQARLHHRPGCLCASRSAKTHKRMVMGSRYEALSI